MKKVINLFFIITLIIIFPNICRAETNVELKTNDLNVNIEGNVNVNLLVSNGEIASADIQIFFDSEKLEYISGPSNSNLVDGRIILTWYNEDGNQKTDLDLGEFIFKAKKEGTTIISLKGNCYDETGNIVETKFKEQEIQIIENNKKDINLEETNININTDNNNAYLKTMRTNQEEIVPNFDKEIFEYYLTTSKKINNLEITAIPENENSKIEIIGNNNFIQGKNEVEIKVTSPDLQIINIYKINVTLTDNLEKANTNLETLAIENAILYPSFDKTITEYKIEIDCNTENLNILAIPENEKANIVIEGKDNLKIGDNKIIINVFAEDELTTRKYNVLVHKRNNEEQKQYEKQEEIETEKLISLLNEENNIGDINENNETASEEKNTKTVLVFLLILLIIVTILFLKLLLY